MSQAPPTRRWFQFRLLGFLLAVGCIGAFLAWVVRERSYIREREDIRQWVLDGQGTVISADDEAEMRRLRIPAIERIPVWREWLGDEGIGAVFLDKNATPADLQRVRTAFPEARYCRIIKNTWTIDTRAIAAPAPKQNLGPLPLLPKRQPESTAQQP